MEGLGGVWLLSINNKVVKKYWVAGFTLLEVLAVVVILGILTAIAAPSVMGIIDQVEADVCEVNRGELESAFETELHLKDMDYSDALFAKFLIEYGEEICPDDGNVYYVNGEVECSEHGGDTQNNGDTGGDEDGEVPYL